MLRPDSKLGLMITYGNAAYDVIPEKSECSLIMLPLKAHKSAGHNLRAYGTARAYAMHFGLQTLEQA